jgi:hypothetical protein
MELFVLFFIAAVGAAWWLNHTWQKKADADAKARLAKQESEAPYKVESAEPVATPVKATEQVEIKPLEVVAETKVEPAPAKETVSVEKPKKPRKPAAKKPVPAAKARVKKSVAKKKAVSSK